MDDPLPRMSRPDRIVLAACLVAGLAARTVFLGRDDFWSDEVHTYRTVTGPAAEVVGERLAAGHVPLYFLLVHGWASLFGDSQFSLRLPSALFGTVLLVPAFALLRRLLPAVPARWALGILAFHPVFVELSREARMYSLLGLVFLVLAEAAVAALDRGRVPLRFWVAAAAGPLVHPTWAFAVVPLAAWVVIEARRGDRGPAEADASRRAARTVAWGSAASVAVLGGLLALATPQHQELTRRPWPRELAVAAARPFVGTDLRRTLLAALVVTAVGWLVCSVRGWLEGDSRARRFATWIGLGVPVASVVTGTLGGVPWGPARYVHLAAVGFAVLASLAALHSARAQARLSAPGASVDPRAGRLAAHPVFRRLREDPVGLPWLVAALALLCGMRMKDPRTPWSDVAREIRGRLPDAVPVVTEDDGSRVVLEHYLGRPVSVAGDATPPGSLRARLDPTLSVPRVRLDTTR